MKEPEAEEMIRNALSRARPGEKVDIAFHGIPGPVDVSIRMQGGWEVFYTITTGQSFQIIKGHDENIEINITIRPSDRLN